MKKKIIITIISIGIVVAISGVGIAVSASLVNKNPSPHSDAYPDTWYEKEEAAKKKTILMSESAKIERKDSSQDQPSTKSTEKMNSDPPKKEQVLTYVITDGSDEKNPLDIYQDENENQYRYNQSGELDTYKQDFVNMNEIPTEGITEKEAVVLGWKYASQLYGTRVENFQLKQCRLQSEEMGYYVEFVRKYGVDNFISGAGVLTIVRKNGELGASTIGQDLMEDFDETCVKTLTKEEVYASVVPTFEKNHVGCVAGSSMITDVRLIRQDDEFVLRVFIEYKDSSGEIQKDYCYYNL